MPSNAPDLSHHICLSQSNSPDFISVRPQHTPSPLFMPLRPREEEPFYPTDGRSLSEPTVVQSQQQFELVNELASSFFDFNRHDLLAQDPSSKKQKHLSQSETPPQAPVSQPQPNRNPEIAGNSRRQEESKQQKAHSQPIPAQAILRSHSAPDGSSSIYFEANLKPKRLYRPSPNYNIKSGVAIRHKEPCFCISY